MIEEPPVLRIKRPSRRPTVTQIAPFQSTATSFVVDAMYGDGALGTEIKPLHDQTVSVAGPALTVDCVPGDILGLLGALSFIQKGDVVVSAFAGFQGCAAAGDRVSGMMKNCGVVGFVTDGPMRDLEGLLAVGLPSWCTGLNPGSPFSTGPGKIGHPIQIAGQRVETGDLIVADRDGVVVVPFEKIDQVIETLAKVQTLETELDAEIVAGLKVPEAISELMRSDRVLIED